MNRTTILTGLSLTLLLAGCYVPRFTDTDDCDVANSITLRHGEGVLALDKGCIAADPGTQITLVLEPTAPIEPRRVVTYYRGFGNRWLDQVDEDGMGTITLPVPPEEDEGPFKYWIKVKDVGKLDPRIIIQ